MNCPEDWLKEACRSKEKGEKAAAEIVRTSNNPAVRYQILIKFIALLHFTSITFVHAHNIEFARMRNLESTFTDHGFEHPNLVCFAKGHAAGFGITSLST